MERKETEWTNILFKTVISFKQLVIHDKSLKRFNIFYLVYNLNECNIAGTTTWGQFLKRFLKNVTALLQAKSTPFSSNVNCMVCSDKERGKEKQSNECNGAPL